MSVHMLFIRVHYYNTRYYEFANRFGNVFLWYAVCLRCDSHIPVLYTFKHVARVS